MRSSLGRVNSLVGGHHSAKFGGHRHCGIGDILVLVCHVISHDQVIIGSCDLMGRSLSMEVTIQQSLVVIATLVVEICF